MLNAFLGGAVSMGFLIAALFFVRFWRSTRDRLFLYFASAFVVLMGERIIRELLAIKNEWVPLIYLLRLAAFILILIAIVDKNRRA
jgi:membrane-associated PAP2 superfamily phosphatase